MGRVDNAPSPKMKHFSHPHELELWNNFQPQQGLVNVSLVNVNPSTLCSACKLPASENMYICKPCNFFLHLTCAQFPQFINHPAHKNHTLSLLPIAAYPGGYFNCDACNCQGNGFSYHCGSCEFDLHVLCASKPLKFTHQFHSCQLELTFTNPYDNAKGFSCDICHKFGSKQWLYRCAACEFDVHLDCITASPAPAVVVHGRQPQLLQHNRSFPGGNIRDQVGLGQPAQSSQSHIPQHHQYMHSANVNANLMDHPGQFQPTTSANPIALQGQFQPTTSANPIALQGQFQPDSMAALGVVQVPVMHVEVVRPNVLMHSASTGQLGNVQQPNRTSGLMSSVIPGLVEGAAQQAGQSLVQGVIGVGSGGGSGSGGDGSSILGGLFGDSSEAQN